MLRDTISLWRTGLGVLMWLPMAGLAQPLAIQPRLFASHLAGTAGLPSPGRGGFWAGWASTDTLARVTLRGAATVGAQRGGSFDLGLAVRLYKGLTVVAHTAGLTQRLKDANPEVSVLQRQSLFGAMYRHKGWGFMAGVERGLTQTSAPATAEAWRPTMSAEWAYGSGSRLGLRLANPTGAWGMLSGTVGRFQADSAVLQPDLRRNFRAPTELEMNLLQTIRFKKLSIQQMSSLGYAWNGSPAFRYGGRGTHGLLVATGAVLSYKKKYAAMFGVRAMNLGDFYQTSFGLSANFQQMTIQYSSYNFLYEGRQRLHLLGVQLTFN